jgi:hypothetical protein
VLIAIMSSSIWFSRRQAQAVLHGLALSTWSCLRLAEARLFRFLPSNTRLL